LRRGNRAEIIEVIPASPRDPALLLHAVPTIYDGLCWPARRRSWPGSDLTDITTTSAARPSSRARIFGMWLVGGNSLLSRSCNAAPSARHCVLRRADHQVVRFGPISNLARVPTAGVGWTSALPEGDISHIGARDSRHKLSPGNGAPRASHKGNHQKQERNHLML